MAIAETGCIEEATTQQRELLDTLLRLQVFPAVSERELSCLVAEAEEMSFAADEVLAEGNGHLHHFMILFDGKIRVTQKYGNTNLLQKTVSAPAFMGEIAILSNLPNFVSVVAVTPIRGVQVPEEGFWRVMANCPTLRKFILDEMTMRTHGLNASNAQQEKLAMLGTMTAGLMHELNNPGAAARRAASQLRENLKHLHQLARAFSERGHTASQRACLTRLQERVLASSGTVCMDSLQQSDAEEEMGTWMEEHAISDAWKLAPTLVASGLGVSDLNCLQRDFPDSMNEPLQWLEATASSMQQVSLVEDSVSRVHDLAKAVKTYVHEGQGSHQTVYVNESLHATLMILKHKLREKNLRIQKEFGANLPPLFCVCSGLNQIWTNLLDNAIDAVDPGGLIRIRTWKEGDNVLIGIGDNGPGIPPESRERIFDPFFTTKPAGVGTGMGLGIVQRMVETYNGHLELKSKPGDTEFIVQIPVQVPEGA